jgi:uncharacterized protein involved in cysteine biosynthesis
MSNLVNVIFPILIGFFMAVMDRTTEEVAFNNSIFRNLNPKWWLRSVSWEYVKFIPFTKYRPDAWHLAKSSLILSIAFMTVFSLKITNIPILNVLINGSVITGSFVVFYDYILKRKTKTT